MASGVRTTNPGVLDTACRRVKEELGCSDEQAFDLLYGWACDCKDQHVYGLAQVVTRRSCLPAGPKARKN